MKGFLNLSKNLLLSTAKNHDESKFKEPERKAYILMNWDFYCKKKKIKFDLSKDIETIIKIGHLHHITHNLHHPEAHKNINTMSTLHIVEMVCDWTAISEELSVSEGSCLPWATREIDKKWQFSLEMKTFIFSVIHELDWRKKNI